jgi:hypothetical protein
MTKEYFKLDEDVIEKAKHDTNILTLTIKKRILDGLESTSTFMQFIAIKRLNYLLNSVTDFGDCFDYVRIGTLIGQGLIEPCDDNITF